MFQRLTLDVLSLYIATVIITAAILIVTYHIHRFTYWRRRGVYYLKPGFPFGAARDFILGRINFAEQIRDWYFAMKKRGWMMGGSYFYIKSVLIPVEEKLIKELLINDFAYFPNRGFFVDEKVEPFSGHIINKEGYEWKNLRARLPAAFTAAKMRRNVVVMEAASRQFIAKLNDLSQRHESIDIKEILTRYAIDTFVACEFGMESRTLYDENRELVKYSKSFVDYHWSRTILSLTFFFPRRILSILKFKTIPAAARKYFMDMFRKIKDHREKEPMKRHDLTDLLIDLCDETKRLTDFNGEGEMSHLNFIQFASQMYVFFVTGFESSSTTQTFALYELATNQQIQEKLREEINNVLERYHGEVGYDSINEMEYLDRVVYETLRKYPIVPIIPRKCIKDYRVPNTNITIEKGTLIVISPLGIHHDPDYYPNPTIFDPDRFTKENKARRPHCSYLPFGDGPRACIGKRFGIWQIKVGILSVIRNFKITLSKQMKLPMKFSERGTVLKPKGAVWIDFEKVN